MKTLLSVLPLAIVMSAGPQIVTAVFLSTSRNARANSLAFLAAVAAATTIGVTVFYFLGNAVAPDEAGEDSGRNWLDYVILGLLLFMAIRIYLRRNDTAPPKWMGRLESADPRFAAKIGLLLYLLMPTDVISMATVGAYLAREDAPWRHSLGFVGLTVLIAGLPFIMLLALGRRAEVVLPKARAWMNANSWIVSEAVILFFLAMALFG
jgi:threonine/homoserine/homoserine lactone efflux protein